VASVVFLRAVNVGKANRCQPALIAKQLAKFGVVNIGAVGTFVVRENVSESTLRPAIAKKLPFKCEIMICPARDVIKRGFGPIIAPLKTHFLGLIRLSFILSRSRSGAQANSPLFALASLLVRFDQIACFIEKANHSIM
jgi:hypothetical protein